MCTAQSETAAGAAKSSLVSWRCFNWLCVIVVLLVIGIRTWNHRGPDKATALPVAGPTMGDFDVNIKASEQLVQDDDHVYPRDFVYPPPAVLLWHSFGKLGYPAGAIAWLAILSGGLAGALLLAARITSSGSARQGIFEPPSGVIVALTFAATQYYCIWDLSVANINSIYLFLVLGGLWGWLCNRRVLAGVLLGLSVALKIYSVVFLPFLLLRREWRVALAMLFSLAFFFFFLPCAYFGPTGAWEITRNWLHTVSSASNPDYMLYYTGYRMSLSWMAMLLLDPRASAGKLNVLDWSPEAVLWLVRLAHAGWILLVCSYFATSRRLPLQTGLGRLALAFDASVLLMFPLPLSPFLQPPHPVVLLVPAAALLRYAFEGRVTVGKRFGSLLAVASCCFVELAHYPWRGIGAMLTIAGLFAGIWMARHDLTQASDTLERDPHEPVGSDPTRVQPV